MPTKQTPLENGKHNFKEDLIMSLRIQNNIAAMTAHRNLTVSDAAMGRSLEKLSSGFRINSAKDDAAGLAISQTFRANIASVKVAQRNITEANSLLQTAEGALDTVGNILTRMKELATQAASANVGNDIGKVSAEYNELVSEIDRITGSTKYAGVALLDGNFSAKVFQIGYEGDSNSQLSVTISAVNASGLGVASNQIATAGGAQSTLTTLNTAIGTLATTRGTIGAKQNRLSYASANLQITAENLTAAESVIRDVDMAAEMTNFTKNQIFMQAGTAMLAQANMAPQNVLSLFG
jgi:flagellin